MGFQPLYYQLLAVFTANMNVFGASLLSVLHHPVDHIAARWFLLSYLKGVVIGSAIAAVTLSYIGRRISILLTAVPIIMGLVVTDNAVTAFHVYVARWLFGIANGLVLTSALIYLTELSVKNRGFLASSIVVARILGALVPLPLLDSNASPPAYSYFWIVPSLLSVTILLVPESPYTYIKKDDIHAARRSLTLFRGNDRDFEGIVAAVKENNGGLMTLFRRDGCAKGLAIAVSLRIIDVMCGFQFITVTFNQTGITYFSTERGQTAIYMIFYAVPIVTSIVGGILVDKVGRRPLLIASLLGVFVCLVAEVVRTFVSNSYMIYSDASSVINIAIVTLYVVSYYLGCANVLFFTSGEVFPLHVRSLGVALTEIATAWVIVGSNAYLEKISELAWHYFITYLVAVPVAAWFVWKRFIETKGKSLEEIHEQLKSQRERFASKPHQQNMHLLSERRVQ